MSYYRIQDYLGRSVQLDEESWEHIRESHPEGKPRFLVVVVKGLREGLFISTAMTTNAMKSGQTLYRKGEGR